MPVHNSFHLHFLIVTQPDNCANNLFTHGKVTLLEIVTFYNSVYSNWASGTNYIRTFEKKNSIDGFRA